MDECNCQIHISSPASCKTTDVTNSQSFLTCSSSHANNHLHHFHTSTFTPHPKVNNFATVSILFSANPYKRLNISDIRVPSTQWSLQNKVEDPYPILRLMFSTNQLTAPTPTPPPRCIEQSTPDTTSYPSPPTSSTTTTYQTKLN